MRSTTFVCTATAGFLALACTAKPPPPAEPSAPPTPVAKQPVAPPPPAPPVKKSEPEPPPAPPKPAPPPKPVPPPRPVHQPNITLQHIDPAAEAAAKAGKFTECGNTYALRVRRQPRSGKAAHLMFNAAVCYERAKKIGHALRYYQTLVSRHQTSPFAARGLLGVARVAERILMYGRAARALNRFIRVYTGSAKPAHYRRAMRLFVALGNTRAAMNILIASAKNLGAKYPKLNAELAFMVTKLLKNPRRRAAHLNRFLRLAGRASPHHQMLAHAMLGEYHWQRSCKNTTRGLCIKVSSVGHTRASHTCLKGAGTEVKAGSRSAIAATMAERHLARAVRLHKRLKAILPKLKPPVRRAANLWAAKARMYLADKDLEAYVQIHFPKNLDFDVNNRAVKKASQRRFVKYVKQRKQTMARLSKTYQAIRTQAGPGAEAIAAMAASRIALLAQNFADDILLGGMPRDITTGKFAKDKMAAFCAEIHKVTAPLQDIAAKAYSYCVRTAAIAGIATKISRHCEDELASLRPRKHPSHNELVYATPNRVGRLRTKPGLNHWQAERSRDLMKLAPYVRIAEIYLARAVATKRARRRNLGMADKNLMSAVAIAPNHPRANALLAVYEFLHPRTKTNSLVARRLRRTLRRRSTNAMGWNALGLMLTKQGKTALAVRAFTSAVGPGGGAEAARFNRGLLWLDARNYREAVKALQPLVKRHPNDVQAQIALGVALRGAGKIDRAEKHYKAALAKNPRAGDALYNLALLYKNHHAPSTGVAALAIAHYRTAISYFKRARRLLEPAHRRYVDHRIRICQKTIRALAGNATRRKTVN